MTYKVLHVIQSFKPESGGPPEGLRQLINYFSKSHDSRLIIDVASLDQDADPLPSTTLSRTFRLKKSYYDKLFPFSLLSWLLKHSSNYDCIIVNGVWDWHLFVVWISSLATKIPYAVFAHGHLDPWFKKRYPFKHFKKWLFWPWAIFPPLKSARKVVFTCDQERILARSSFSLYSVSEYVVSYGTAGLPSHSMGNKEMFLGSYPHLADYEIFLFLSRIHPKKGLDILLSSFSILKSKGLLDFSLHRLVIAGPSNPDYLSHLKQLSTDLKISEFIAWIGPLYEEMKWSAFQSSSVFLLPSYQENFGIAVAESLSCSTPVIISSSVNISPIISSCEAGFVSKSLASSQYADLLETWIKLPESDRRLMKQNARDCFETYFSINSFAHSYFNLISDLSFASKSR